VVEHYSAGIVRHTVMALYGSALVVPHQSRILPGGQDFNFLLMQFANSKTR
jgi:hypothetical protein